MAEFAIAIQADENVNFARSGKQIQEASKNIKKKPLGDVKNTLLPQKKDDSKRTPRSPLCDKPTATKSSLKAFLDVPAVPAPPSPKVQTGLKFTIFNEPELPTCSEETCVYPYLDKCFGEKSPETPNLKNFWACGWGEYEDIRPLSPLPPENKHCIECGLVEEGPFRFHLVIDDSVPSDLEELNEDDLDDVDENHYKHHVYSS